MRAKAKRIDIELQPSILAWWLWFFLALFIFGLILCLNGFYLGLLLPWYWHFRFIYKRYIRLSHPYSIKRLSLGRTTAQVHYRNGKVSNLNFHVQAVNFLGLTLKLNKIILHIFPDQLPPCRYKQLRVYLIYTRT